MKSSSNSPYWPILPSAIALAGIMVFIFASFGPPASSSGFVTTLKGFLQPLAPEYVAAKAHYRMLPGPGSWLMAFVLGMAIGGFVGGRSFQQQITDMPDAWRQCYGERSQVKRYLTAFAGGFLILFGARLAGGCTLGLFLSGSTQLAISGLYFGVVIFLVAMLTTRFVYRNRRIVND